MAAEPVSIVTGAAGGLGSAIAKALPGEIIAVDLKAADGVFELDCSDEAQVRAFYENLNERGRSVRGLVNVAGMPGEKSLADMDVGYWDDVFKSNVTSAMLMTRFAIPLLGKGSAIVNFASLAASRGFAKRAAYCAAKAAITGLTRAAAVELAPQEVRVNAVAPGSIDSPWITRLIDEAPDSQAATTAHEQRALLGRLGKSAEIGALVKFLLSDEAAFITGAVYAVDGGATAY